MIETRRKFVKKVSHASLGVGCLGIAASLQGCVANYQVASIENEDKLVIDKQLLYDEKKERLRRFVTVKSGRFKERIYVSGIREDDLKAVLLHCTHKGCEVNPAGDILVCPCHGSEYSADGVVLQSPAPRPLKRFTVSQDQQYVYVHLNS